MLARIQANIVAEKIKEEFSNINIEFLTKETSGDIDLSTPLHKMPDPGVFTNDIREELLKNKADLAVHSWKTCQLNCKKELKYYYFKKIQRSLILKIY